MNLIDEELKFLVGKFCGGVG